MYLSSTCISKQNTMDARIGVNKNMSVTYHLKHIPNISAINNKNRLLFNLPGISYIKKGLHISEFIIYLVKRKRNRDTLCPTKKDTCAICFEEKEIKDFTVLNACNHVYCSECITEWAKKENTCPQCKERFTLLDIPGRKRRKRVEHKNLGGAVENEIDIDQQEHIISMAVMNYIASQRFRDYIARTILRTPNIRASILWNIIQRALPPLSRQVRDSILENTTNIGQMSLDILEATDAMLRLRYASTRESMYL